MSKRQWTKFKDEIPKTDQVWATNFQENWILDACNTGNSNWYWHLYAKDHPEVAWSPIELLEVPREELHDCSGCGGCYCVEVESLDGDRRLILNIPMTGHATHLFNVYQCPFCGYEARK